MNENRWRKSTYSTSNGGNCIEVADRDHRVIVRDTNDRTGPVLRFTPAVWRKFAIQLKRSLSSDLNWPCKSADRERSPAWGAPYAISGNATVASATSECFAGQVSPVPPKS
jgi:hypothetical protein